MPSQRVLAFLAAALLLLASVQGGFGILRLLGLRSGIDSLATGDCGRCGTGLLNLCDERECLSLGACAFTQKLIGGTCADTQDSVYGLDATSGSIVIRRDIPYGSEDKQVLDLCRPKTMSGKVSGVILIHGGGGDKSDFMRSCKLLAAGGYVAATINYREEPAPAYPMLLDDARLALSWLRARPEVDSTRMGAMGGSAGGYLSSHLGTRQDTERVQCVVNNFGPTDWSDPAVGGSPDMYERFTTKLFGNVTAEDDPGLYADASPITHVTSDDADFVFTRSVNDHLVPRSQAERMIAALRAAGKTVPDLYEFNATGSAHALQMSTEEMLKLWRFQKGFLDSCLTR